MEDDKKTDNTEIENNQPTTPIVDWDDSEMNSTHANVVNASSTREEVNIFFGTNETWKANESHEFHVKLNNRIVLSPYCAKRLWVLLGGVLKQYENRFGQLDIAGGSAPQSSDKPS